MPREDGLRFDEDERPSPVVPDAREAHLEQAVGARQPESASARPLQDMELVSQREHLELRGRARADRTAEGHQERDENGHHRREAYPQLSMVATSTLATRTEFSVGTASEMSRISAILCTLSAPSLRSAAPSDRVHGKGR
jgi:hypothetical protein